MCENALQQQEEKPRIDPFIVMEDIIEKLRLLNYETTYLRKYNKEPISKYYFACNSAPASKPSTPNINNLVSTVNSNIVQFVAFYEMTSWLMGLIKQVIITLDIRS